MVIGSAAALLGALRQYRILDSAQISEVNRLQARFPDPRALARELISRGWLSPYQVNQLFQGNGASLVLGQYLILERLGEGGMGQVFKARHLVMDRVVALKVIRPELVADARVIKRFQREIKTVAQLAHPHIVMAYDADQVGNAHFFVMEYVEGIDLGKLIKETGPPPVGQACDYIRQIALGLQYAHERGMVHRDIKPANLLVTGVPDTSRPMPPGATPIQRHLVKILDMGLARICDEGGESGTLTQFGKLVGTPDYISPEQARNSQTLDIRADLYSLGCTFYFLLTGRVPFPGGTSVEKLIRHQMAEATPVEKVRPEIPAAVAGIVRNLMAKRPQDRFQTPAELADALTVVMGLQGRRAGLAANGSAPAAPPAPMALLAPQPSIGLETPAAAEPAWHEPPSGSSGTYHARQRRTNARQHLLLWLLLVGLMLLGGISLLILVVSFSGRGAHPRRSERPAPPVPRLLKSFRDSSFRSRFQQQLANAKR